MTPELKDAWLEALRSGKYTQGKYQLKAEPRQGKYAHCCLGVLCEVAGLKADSHGVFYDGSEQVTSEKYILLAQLHRFGLPEALARELAYINDNSSNFSAASEKIETSVPTSPT